MAIDEGNLNSYIQHIRRSNKSFPAEWIPYLIEGIIHQLNEHRDIFIEGAKYVQYLGHRHGYEFRLEYDPRIKTATGEEILVDFLCQYDPNTLAGEGGVWDIWIRWNKNVPDSDLEALSVPFSRLKDENFRFHESNLWTVWMP